MRSDNDALFLKLGLGTKSSKSDGLPAEPVTLKPSVLLSDMGIRETLRVKAFSATNAVDGGSIVADEVLSGRRSNNEGVSLSDQVRLAVRVILHSFTLVL